ncbi:MAG: hypothetical protein JSU70_22765 [Phycisphaerales bacterium]|nr:MAG: hypothetical protein JSU70_22765 [Phycisphaerales bacterium]
MKQTEMEALVKKLHVQPGAEMYDRTLTDTLEAQEIWKKKSAVRRPNLWRFIMESRVTRYSAAAVVALAMALVLLGPFGPSKNGGVLLAEVGDNITNMDTMVVEGTRYATFEDPEKPPREVTVRKWLSSQHGYVEEQYEGDTLMHRSYMCRPEKAFVMVFPRAKKYLRWNATEAQIELLDKLTPRGMVEAFISSDCSELGKKEIDGVEVEGFESRNLHIVPDIPKVLADMNDLSLRLWVNVETSLPVRLEADVDLGKSLLTGFSRLHLREVNSFVEFNPQLDPNMFDPNIPADYTEFKVTDLVPAQAGLVGLGIIPAGFLFWRRQRRKRATASRT